MAPQIRPHPNLQNLWILYGKRDWWVLFKLKILRWGDYPALSRWAWRDHNGPYKRDARGIRVGVRETTAEAEVGMMKERPRAKGWGQPLETGERKETGSSLEPPVETSPAGTLILAQWDLFQTSILWNCKDNVYCFKSPDLWEFVTVALENWYK